MNEIIKSPLFINWLSRQDSNIVKRVNATLLKMEGGNLGDHKQIDSELHEARIHIHSGIRLYYMWHGKEIILLLAGGNKATQSKDIEKAKEMIERIKEGISWTIN